MQVITIAFLVAMLVNSLAVNCLIAGLVVVYLLTVKE